MNPRLGNYTLGVYKLKPKPEIPRPTHRLLLVTSPWLLLTALFRSSSGNTPKSVGRSLGRLASAI